MWVRQYGWLLLIGAVGLNVLVIWWRSWRYVAEDPSRAPEYRRLIAGIAFWGNLPWIVMGLGCTVGGVPNIFRFLRPGDGEPFVLAFYAVVYLLILLSAYWVFMARGAEKVLRYKGVLDVPVASVAGVKWYLGVSIIAVAIMNGVPFFVRLPVP